MAFVRRRRLAFIATVDPNQVYAFGAAGSPNGGQLYASTNWGIYMRIRYSAAVMTSGLLACAGAAPAQAGLVDGSLNNAHVLDHGNVLGAMATVHVGDDRSNNANA